MLEKDKIALRDASPYNAAITREQFLFYEVRTTAKLVCEEFSNDEIVDRIVKENLFQYPTEKSVKKMALACLRRLDALEDSSLVEAIAVQPSDVSKQICLCHDAPVPAGLGFHADCHRFQVQIIGYFVW